VSRIERISWASPPETEFGYSRAVKAGGWVKVSGCTARDETVAGVGQMYSQAKAALTKLVRALEQAGASVSDVVRTRIFVTDVSRTADIARAHHEIFGSVPPASTLVAVKSLAHPDMMIEIEAEAYVGDSLAQMTLPAKPQKAEVTRKPPRGTRRRVAARKKPAGRSRSRRQLSRSKK